MRILVVSAPVGTGHIVAAKRVAENLRRELADGSTVLVDDVGSMLQLGSWSTTSLISSSYNLGVSVLRGAPHKVMYQAVNHYPSLAERAFRTMFGRQLRQSVLATRPDVVISTFHAVSATLSMLLEPSGIPVISVIPGAGRVNKLWLYGRIATLVFPEVKGAEFAIENGVAVSQVSVIPNVFYPEISGLPTMDEARRVLQISPEFTVLLSFGSSGLGRPGREFLRLLRTVDNNTQILITPGPRRRSIAAAKACLDQSTILVRAEKSLLPCVAAANLVIGKAGWLTLTDASAVGRPTFIIDYIRGQEDENVRVACLSGMARYMTPSQAVECVQRYTQDNRLLFDDFPAIGSRAGSRSGFDGGRALLEIISRSLGHSGS